MSRGLAWACNFCGHRNGNDTARRCAECSRPHWCEERPDYARFSGAATFRNWTCKNRAKYQREDGLFVCAVHNRGGGVR